MAYNGKAWKLSPVLAKEPLDYRKLLAFNFLDQAFGVRIPFCLL